MYITRHIEETVKRITERKGVLIVTGARQVGKSTMLRKTFPNHKYVTLDTPQEFMLAKENPTAFLNKHKGKVIIDEIQRAPELFHFIKADIDELIFQGLEESHKGYGGKYILTVSQSFRLMKNVTESLAGRAGIIEMMGLSKREHNRATSTEPYVPKQEVVRDTKIDYWDTIGKIHRGSYPELYQTEKTKDEWAQFYADYIKTYVEKDVREVINIQNELAFYKFLRAVAALSGQQLNYSTLAEMVGKDVMTMKNWMSVLRASGLVYLLEPYYNNATKRMIKTPKLYMLDTGLICYLGGWETPEQLANGAIWGAIFETYVVGEILKSYHNSGRSMPKIFYFRDKDKKEVDVVIEQNGTLYPVEIKTTTDPNKSMCASFEVLKKIPDKKLGEGAVVCMIDNATPLTNSVWAINVDQI